MKFLKTISIFIILLVCVLTFVGCNKQNSEQNQVTTPESSSENIEQTTEEITTAAPDYSSMKLIATGKVTSKALGIKIAEYKNSNPYIVNVEITDSAVLLYGYTPGTATLELTDFFGHKAKLTATVTEGQRNIDVSIEECTEEFIEVGQFGAKGDGTTNDTKAFQAAIDSASSGETVYVYPGLYKVSQIIMKEGITLKLYTEMTDATKGFTDEIAKDIIDRRYAILIDTLIYNNTTKDSSDKATNNFTISGGVLDCNHTSRGITFGRGDNIRLENIIFKDMKNNHVIQVTGCTNTTIENCVFAGFECGDAFTREIIQIEPSHSGAGALKFEEGEFYYCENITINNCYFGESDELGAPHMAIGHHWYNGKANVTGFKITNNVFNECLYAAIRYNSIVDTEITGNTFISTSKYMTPTQYPEATTPAFILLYHPTSATKYTSITGTAVTRTPVAAQEGFSNLKIENNTFTLEKGSDKRIIYIVNSSYKPGASFDIFKTQDAYDSEIYTFSGYYIHKNYAKDISFSNNTININGQPTYKNYYLKLTSIYDLKFEGNKINIANGVKFTITSDGFDEGQNASSIDSEKPSSYVINTKATDNTITVKFGDKTYKFTCAFSGAFTIQKGNGGYIEATTDKDGNLTITITAAEGYSLQKFTDASQKEPSSAHTTLTAATVFNATFVKK